MKKVKLLALPVLLVLMVSFAVLKHYVPEMMDMARREIIKHAKNNINGALYIDQVRLSGFFEMSADNVKLEDKKGNLVFQSDEVTVGLSILSLLFNQNQPDKAISSVRLAKGSSFYLKMNEEQNWNVEDLFLTTDDTETHLYALLKFNEAKLFLHLPSGQWEFLVTGNINAVRNPVFALDLSVRQQENSLKVSGTFNPDGHGKLVFAADSFAVADFAPLVRQAINVDNFNGEFKDLNILWENSDKGNVFNGRLALAKLSGEYTLGENPFNVILDGALEVKNNKIDFVKFVADINEQLVNVSGSLSLDDRLPQAERLVFSSKSFAVQKVVAASPFVGDADFELLFDGPLNSGFDGLLATGEIKFAQSSVVDFPLDNGKIVFTYKDKCLLLNECEIGVMGGRAKTSAEYDLRTNYLAGSVQFNGLELSKLPQKQQQLAGMVGGELCFSGGPSYDELDFVVNFASEGVFFNSLGISNITASARKSGGTAVLDYFSGNVGAGSFNARGVIAGEPLEISVQGADLPLKDIMGAFGREAAGFLNARLFLHGSWDNLYVDASMHAIDGVVEKQIFSDVQGSFVLRDDVLSIDRLLLEMKYGVHYVNGKVDFAHTEPEFLLAVVSKAVRLEPIAALILPGQKITGNLDSFVVFEGTVDNPQVRGEVLAYEGSYEGYFVEKASGKYFYHNDGVELADFNVKFMQTNVFLHGDIKNDGSIKLSFLGDNIRLENLPQLEGIATSGGIVLNGSMTGTLSKPVFNGDVSSQEVVVNGQTITAIQGTAWSQGGVNNSFRISFRQGQGEYELDAGVDFHENFAHALLQVKNGDVSSLLAVAGQNYEIGGLLNGTITLNSGGKRNGLLLDATIKDAYVRKILFESIDVNLHFSKGKVTIGRFEAQQGIGRVLGRGSADLHGQLDMEIGGSSLDAALLTAFMERPVDFQGSLGFLLQLSGSAQNPEASASLQISPGSVANVAFDNLYGLFSVKDEVFHVDQLFLSKAEYKVSAYGKVPLDLLRVRENRKNPNSQMDLSVKLDNADLSLIPSLFTEYVEWGTGKTEGELKIQGTLETPEYYGGLQIQEGTLKFKYLRNPLDKISLDATFDGYRAVLKHFSAVMGTGNVSAEGLLDISDFSGSDYNLKVRADKLELASEMVTGPLTCSFEIMPQSYRDGLRPLIKGDVLLEHLTINLPVIPDFGDGGYNLGLDVELGIGEKVRLYNKYLYDMLLEGNLHITGSTVFTNIEGTARVKRGTIKYLNTPFRIDTATAGFPIPGSPMPTVNLLASSRISSVDVYVAIHGPLDGMEVVLTSDPPMSQQEIFRLMTLKTRTTEGSTLSEEDMKSLLAAGLQMTLFGNVEDFFRESLGIDEFSIYQGFISSGVGLVMDSRTLRHATREEQEQYNFYVGKYLTDKILLSYTRSFRNNDSRLALQYEINRRLSLATAIDEDNKMYYGIEYRISF